MAMAMAMTTMTTTGEAAAGPTMTKPRAPASPPRLREPITGRRRLDLQRESAHLGRGGRPLLPVSLVGTGPQADRGTGGR